MKALIERLEAAEVGSRELGEEILLANGWSKSLYGHFYGPLYQWWGGKRSIKDDDFHLINPTTSLDAALALAERVLPGWYIGLQQNRGDVPLWSAYLSPPDRSADDIETDAKCAALALCIAILKAKGAA